MQDTTIIKGWFNKVLPCSPYRIVLSGSFHASKMTCHRVMGWIVAPNGWILLIICPIPRCGKSSQRDIPGEITYMSDRARQWAESLPGENFEASPHHRGRLKKRDLQAVHFLLTANLLPSNQMQDTLRICPAGPNRTIWPPHSMSWRLGSQKINLWRPFKQIHN